MEIKIYESSPNFFIVMPFGFTLVFKCFYEKRNDQLDGTVANRAKCVKYEKNSFEILFL